MKTTEKDQMMKKSKQFITENIAATCRQIPDEFRDFWLADSENGNERLVKIFFFAYAEYKIQKGEGDIPMTRSEKEMAGLYMLFQVLLNMPYLNKETAENIADLKLFDFDNYNSHRTYLQAKN